jgi:hypothetical protein
MSLMKDLHARQVVGVILCVILLFIVFGRSTRQSTDCRDCSCAASPKKTQTAAELCQAECPAEVAPNAAAK